MSSDISSILIWWLMILVIGIASWPITMSLFRRFIDRGYIFSKTIGIFLASYLIWLAASLQLLPFTKYTILIILLGLGLVSFWLFSKEKNKNNRKIPWKWIIIEEILFLAALWFWSYVRATEPSIRGLEKFMDFGFVNSILRAKYFPPLDMWLTKSPDYTGGYFINYYYFGHYIAAFLTKLSGINSVITYNLMMATLFAFTFTLSFSLGANLLHLFHLIKEKFNSVLQHNPSYNIKLAVVGLLCAFIVTLGGNLHTIYTFTAGYPNEKPEPFWKLSLGYHPERYWYPNATRLIPNTIHEFPIYSFVVADLHGHVSDIPFVFLILALLMALIISTEYKKHKPPEKKPPRSPITTFLSDFENHTSIPLPMIAFLGVLLSVMYMTNAWDGVIYMILTGLVFLYINLNLKKEKSFTFYSLLYKTASASLFLLFFFLIAGFPFTLNFRPFATGIGVLCAPKFLLDKKIGPFLFETGKCQKSPIYMMMLLWGFFYYNVAGFLLLVIKPQINKTTEGEGAKSNNILAKIKRSLLTPLKAFKNLSPIDSFVLIIIFISTLLLIFPEFLYLKDIYPAHYRANTMFKLGYQAFMMLGIASGYIVFRIKDHAQGQVKSMGHVVYNTVFILLFVLIAIYPYYAISSYYGGLTNYKGLYGLSWMRNQYPDDYNAVIWLRENINCNQGSAPDCNNQPVIVEANGDSYTDYARVSGNTGLPTIVGWPVHEWLWRGSYDEAGKRIPEVATIYESNDMAQTEQILKKYNVDYIFVGTLEQEKYPNLVKDKFDQMGNVVFESGETKIYKVNSNL